MNAHLHSKENERAEPSTLPRLSIAVREIFDHVRSGRRQVVDAPDELGAPNKVAFVKPQASATDNIRFLRAVVAPNEEATRTFYASPNVPDGRIRRDLYKLAKAVAKGLDPLMCG